MRPKLGANGGGIDFVPQGKLAEEKKDDEHGTYEARHVDSRTVL